MHKHWVCAKGHVVHADSDDDLVRKAQEHMKKEHGTEISREDVLKSAHAAEH
jgi:predicted small metal-binding protein